MCSCFWWLWFAFAVLHIPSLSETDGCCWQGCKSCFAMTACWLTESALSSIAPVLLLTELVLLLTAPVLLLTAPVSLMSCCLPDVRHSGCCRHLYLALSQKCVLHSRRFLWLHFLQLRYFYALPRFFFPKYYCYSRRWHWPSFCCHYY